MWWINNCNSRLSSYLCRCRESPAPGSSPACRIAWAARSRAPCSSSWARPPRPAPPHPASRGHYSAGHDHNHSAILIFKIPSLTILLEMNRVCRSYVSIITRFMTVVPVLSIVVSDWLIVCFSVHSVIRDRVSSSQAPVIAAQPGCCCWGGFTVSKGCSHSRDHSASSALLFRARPNPSLEHNTTDSLQQLRGLFGSGESPGAGRQTGRVQMYGGEVAW